MMKQSILNSKGMICPRCEKRSNLFDYKKLMQVNMEKYNTVPIYKCSNCRYVFAPLPDPVEFINS